MPIEMFRWLLPVLLLAMPTAAQCPSDDGLVAPPGTPCCGNGQPQLPPFPGVALSGQGACIRNCGVESTWPVTVAFSAPAAVFSDLYICQVTFGSAPTATFPSLLLMKYARTWTEVGGLRQVWRFLVNTDLYYMSAGAGASPCPIPPCAAINFVPPRPVHFIGHLDYAYDCSSNTWSAAYSLTHLCEFFMHGPLSQRPLPSTMSHVDRTYAFVGPAPFTFGPIPTAAGFLAADSQRSTDLNLNASPIHWDCLREITVVSSLCGSGTAPCPCGNTTTVTPMWRSFVIGLNVLCGGNLAGTFIPVPLTPFLPTGMGVLSLGSFNGPPATFPGTRQIELWIGLANAADPCPVALPFGPLQAVVGVAHHSGSPGTTFPNENSVSVTTDRFVDLQNMLIPNATFPGGAIIGIGSLFVASQVWGICFI